MREIAGDSEGEGETKTLYTSPTRSVQEIETSVKAGS